MRGAVVGRTMVMYRAAEHELLENMLRAQRLAAARTVARVARGRAGRRRAGRWWSCRARLVAALATCDEALLVAALEAATAAGAIALPQTRAANALVARLREQRELDTALRKLVAGALDAAEREALGESLAEAEMEVEPGGALDMALAHFAELCELLQRAARRGLRSSSVFGAERLRMALQSRAEARVALVGARGALVTTARAASGRRWPPP